MQQLKSGNKDNLSFDFSKFAGGYSESRFNMYFPKKGVQLPTPNRNSFSNTLEVFKESLPDDCVAYWKRYLYAIERHCGEWQDRGCVALPDNARIPVEMMMLAGVLQVDETILQASFKRLFGYFIEEKETLITEDELLTVAFALWNPIWTEYKSGKTWREFVDGLNLQHSIRVQHEARQQAVLAELLTELG